MSGLMANAGASFVKGLVVEVAPFVGVAGGAGYLSHRVTDGIADARPDQLEPRPIHTETAVNLFAPVPAVGVGVAAIGAAMRYGFGTKRVLQDAEIVGTNQKLQIATYQKAGWTIGPRMLRAAGIGSLVGAGIAVGLTVPVVSLGAKLLGKGTDAAVRAALPDWAEGPAFRAQELQSDAAKAVLEFGKRLFTGPEPEVHRYESTFEVAPGTFDPERSLGLDQGPIKITVQDESEVGDALRSKILDRIEGASGVRPEPVAD